MVGPAPHCRISSNVTMSLPASECFGNSSTSLSLSHSHDASSVPGGFTPRMLKGGRLQCDPGAFFSFLCREGWGYAVAHSFSLKQKISRRGVYSKGGVYSQYSGKIKIIQQYSDYRTPTPHQGAITSYFSSRGRKYSSTTHNILFIFGWW